jgi:hypothetical protein
VRSSGILSLFLTALSVLPARPATYLVNPEGTGDFPTIQAAVDAAENGDIILLADGVFSGDGNRDIGYRGKAITVRSESGNPEECIIDCGGSPEDFHRGFYFQAGELPSSRLEGLTIRNGVVGGDD